MLSHRTGSCFCFAMGVHNMLWCAVATIQFVATLGASPSARDGIQWCSAIIAFHSGSVPIWFPDNHPLSRVFRQRSCCVFPFPRFHTFGKCRYHRTVISHRFGCTRRIDVRVTMIHRIPRIDRHRCVRCRSNIRQPLCASGVHVWRHRVWCRRTGTIHRYSRLRPLTWNTVDRVREWFRRTCLRVSSVPPVTAAIVMIQLRIRPVFEKR